MLALTPLGFSFPLPSRGRTQSVNPNPDLNVVLEGERRVPATENGPGATLTLRVFETEDPEIVALKLVAPDFTPVKLAV